jgi:predicted  nucleic acid-binding Zn-ribbon protein
MSETQRESAALARGYEACLAEIKDMDAAITKLKKELDEARGKVERLEKSAEEHPPHDDKCKCDFCYFARLLRQILTGEG